MFLLGVKATKNDRGVTDVILYDTKMSVPVKAVGVAVIEGSRKSGRIFFGGRINNDIYEFSYQVGPTQLFLEKGSTADFFSFFSFFPPSF